MDGPSLVLDAVAIETCNFGEMVTANREFPSFKLLAGGLIPELKVSVTDDNGKSINNNGQPITVTPEIFKNEHLRGWNTHQYSY